MTDQEKREKVIKGLERCIPMTERNGIADCCNCPYDRKITLEGGVTECCHDLFTDALALLKAQEPVEPIPTTDDDWTCGHCGMSLVGYEELDVGGFTTVRHNFCPKCGRAVKWE